MLTEEEKAKLRKEGKRFKKLAQILKKPVISKVSDGRTKSIAKQAPPK